MGQFHTVAKVGDIPEGEGRAFPVGGRLVAVFCVDGEYWAIDDVCPHQGASLAGGTVEGGSVVCPWHAWKFCIRRGKWLDCGDSSLGIDTFATRVVGDEVQVEVPNSDDAGAGPTQP
ncbi:MAG: Rieske 2Fe-2S domain-containing protein [Planctomycetes bacterium]|nr:Rieske 2Fe-2S domain-containing protein [Planctomycetota bacterium]